MSRTSSYIYINGQLVNGFDYTRQAWVKDGFYVRCGHPETMRCGCFGRTHAGEASLATFDTDKNAFLASPAPRGWNSVDGGVCQ